MKLLSATLCCRQKFHRVYRALIYLFQLPLTPRICPPWTPTLTLFKGGDVSSNCNLSFSICTHWFYSASRFIRCDYSAQLLLFQRCIVMKQFYFSYKKVKHDYSLPRAYAVICGRFNITVNWDYLHPQTQGKLATVCLQRFSSIFESTIQVVQSTTTEPLLKNRQRRKLG